MIFCAFPLLSFAAEQRINVDTKGWLEAHRGRSILSVPVLTHDDNLLFIYSDVPLENLQVQVEDEFGNVVYVDNVSVAAGQKYSFMLEGLFSGNYMIELFCGEKSLWGCLDI